MPHRTSSPDIHKNIDYIEAAYGRVFRSGTNEAAETFYLLYQQFHALGNEESTELFLSRILPMLPQATQRRILNEVMENPQLPRRND
jgi:hypothetical protein